MQRSARIVRGGRFDSAVDLHDLPLAGAELVALDTETNGRGGELCELTEVGAVLVGGGELHESWESLVRVERPLSRGIERFTGITQAMVDLAPPPASVLAQLARMLEGRVMVAHSAAFDRRVLCQAFERAQLDWPDPPALCTLALARRFAPLVRQRRLALLAEALGIEVEVSHRALPDATTCARVLCALFPKLCAHAATVGEAVELLRSRSGRRAREPEARRRAPESRPRQVDAALGLFEGPDDARQRLLDAIEGEMRAASAARRYERAAALLRRRERLDGLLGRLGGVLRAVHAVPRLVIACHPAKARFDAFWIVGGRVVDWGPLPGPDEVCRRTEAVLARRARREVAPDEVDEVRIVAAWTAEHEPPALALDPPPAPERLAGLAALV